MLKFLRRFKSEVLGILSGLDRIRFGGTKRFVATLRGMSEYLWRRQIRLKDFSDFAQETTRALRGAVQDQAEQWGHPIDYLNSYTISKEDTALALARQRGISEGLVAVLSCVERCQSFTVRRNASSRVLELCCIPMKCLFYYHYFLDPRFGLLHVRTQTWFPFTVHICLNGREWLAHQMDAAGIRYVKRDNCFIDVADLPGARRLVDAQLRTNWPMLLDEWVRKTNPAHDSLFASCPLPYYWSVEESEWASDIMFRSPEALAALMPRLVRHGVETLTCVDVLRFLGRREPTQCGTAGHFKGEVVTDLKRRPEGVRLLHRLNRNWMKMYDKQGSVLRIETVINDPRDMKVFRAKEGDRGGPKEWLQLRKGVVDLRQRVEISQKCNERYADSLATLKEVQPLGELTERLSRPASWKGRRARALNPLAEPDAPLLQAVAHGEFLLNGFRNRDLRSLLYPAEPKGEKEARRLAAAVTRKIRLLRAHGVIQKVSKTNRYVLTEYGRAAIAALTAARNADVNQLLTAA
jgi:hypothetical protein